MWLSVWLQEAGEDLQVPGVVSRPAMGHSAGWGEVRCRGQAQEARECPLSIVESLN